jgi:hypothetical protein
MTPELFYGTYERDAGGRLIPRGGLKDCLSVYGTMDRFDINTAHPALLATAGLSPEAVMAVVERRRMAPFRSYGEIAEFGHGAPGFGRLRLGGNSIFTIRGTARINLPNGGLSEVRRTVAAVVKYMPDDSPVPYHILRWYDHAWSN